MADIQFPNQLLNGSFSAAVLDNNGVPTNVLEAAQPFTITTSWKVSALAALLLGGEWRVSAYVESIGPGPEQQVGPTETVLLNGGTNYAVNIVVPANTLPDLDPAGNPAVSGAYKIVTLLAHRNFGKFSDVSAIVEGPILRIG